MPATLPARDEPSRGPPGSSRRMLFGGRAARADGRYLVRGTPDRGRGRWYRAAPDPRPADGDFPERKTMSLTSRVVSVPTATSGIARAASSTPTSGAPPDGRRSAVESGAASRGLSRGRLPQVAPIWENQGGESQLVNDRLRSRCDWGRALFDSAIWIATAWAIARCAPWVLLGADARLRTWGRQFWRVTATYLTAAQRV